MDRVKITGADDLARVSKQLRTVLGGSAMRRDLTKGLKAATKPVVVDVKAAAVRLPVRKPSKHHLRRRMAAGATSQVRTGGRNPAVAVRISTRPFGALPPPPAR